jgi:Large ribosomal RNA subunit accumulation protein YceD
MARTEHPWTVPIRVDDVPETGRRVELTADESIRATLAEAAGVNGLTRLEATFDLTRRGRSGLHVVGEISATVRQTCVVTLEPILNEVVEPVDLLFAPAGAQTSPAAELPVEAGDPPEPIVDGRLDLGALATEFLILGIDPYPRKPGAVFEALPSADRDATAFAALAALKKSDGGTER